MLQTLRIYLIDNFGSMENSDGVKVAIRLPNSTRVERFFKPQDSTQVKVKHGQLYVALSFSFAVR